MRRIELDRVEIGGESFPIRCDLFVLERIQEQMSINEFERRILGAEIVRDENGEPIYDDNNRIKLVFKAYDIECLLMGLTLMINEGLEIEADQDGTECEPVDETYLGRIMDMPMINLSNMVHEAFNKCFESKKKPVRTPQKKRKSTRT